MILISLLFAVFNSAQALPATNDPSKKPYDLLKCNSEKHGTVWASFGGVIKHDSNEREYFLTEVVYFDTKGSTFRKVFMSWEQALEQATISHGPGRFSIKFNTTINGAEQTQLIQLIVTNKYTPNSFAGNWQLSESEKTDSMSSVFCTIN